MGVPSAALFASLTFALLLCCATAFYPINPAEKKSLDGFLEGEESGPDQPRSRMLRTAFMGPFYGQRLVSAQDGEVRGMAPQMSSSAEEEELAEVVPSPAKKNFYTHIWRDVVNRMPAFRGGRRFRTEHLDGIDKRSPSWFDRAHAIRVGK